MIKDRENKIFWSEKGNVSGACCMMQTQLISSYYEGFSFDRYHRFAVEIFGRNYCLKKSLVKKWLLPTRDFSSEEAQQTISELPQSETRQSGKPLTWKWSSILMKVKLIFTSKGLPLASFWKWKFLELGKASYLGVIFSSTVRFTSHVVPSLSPDP